MDFGDRPTRRTLKYVVILVSYNVLSLFYRISIGKKRLQTIPRWASGKQLSHLMESDTK